MPITRFTDCIDYPGKFCQVALSQGTYPLPTVEASLVDVGEERLFVYMTKNVVQATVGRFVAHSKCDLGASYPFDRDSSRHMLTNIEPYSYADD